MSQADHRLNVVVTTVGLDQATQQFDSFGQTASGLVTNQTALQGALGKTQGAAIKTGQEFTKTEKAIEDTGKTSQTTGKQTQTLGEAFKSSALQITAFTSGIVSTIGQFINYQKQTASLERLQGILQTRWIGLEQAEKKLAAQIQAGTLVGADAALATEKLAVKREILERQTELLEAKEQQHQLSLINLATTIIPTVINGIDSVSKIYTSLKDSAELASQGTQGLSETTDVLNTTSQTATTLGVIPLIKNLAEWVTGNKDVTLGMEDVTSALQNNYQHLQKTEDGANFVVRGFTAMVAGAKSFGTGIKTDVGGSISIIDKTKTGFTSFFSHLGTGLTGLVGNFKKAGTAIKAVAISIGNAFMAHPILAAIGLVSAALGALIFDLGGVRTALNQWGKALGDAVPFLRPLLDGLGWFSNQLKGVGDMLMGTQKSLESTGSVAQKTALDFDPLLQALASVLDLGPKFQNLQQVITIFENVRAKTAELRKEYDFFKNPLGAVTKGYDELKKSISDTFAVITDKSPEVQQAQIDLIALVEKAQAEEWDLEKARAAILAQLNTLYNTIARNVDIKKEDIETTQKQSKALQDGSAATTYAGTVLQQLAAEAENSTEKYKLFSLAFAKGQEWLIEKLQLSKPELEEFYKKFKEDFPGITLIVTKWGKETVVSLDSVRTEFAGTSKDITTFVEQMKKDLTEQSDTVTYTYQNIIDALQERSREEQIAADISKIAASGIVKDNWLMFQAVDDLAKKYGMSKEEVVKAINEIYDESEKLEQQKEKEIKTTEKQIEKAKSLAETRQDEIAVDKELKTSAEELITQLGRQIEVQGMSGEGLQKLIQIQDDTANAYTVAADSVGLWWANLERSQAVEEQERAALVKLAYDHGVTLPDAIINGSVEAMKKYLAEATGMADVTEDSAQRIRDAIDSIAEKSQSGLEDLIKEDLIKGDLDDVIEKLEETGRSIEQLSVQQVLIKPLLETQEFNDDLTSLSELIGSKWGEASMKSKEGANEVMQKFFEGLRETHGEEVEPLISTMDTMWTNLNKMYPDKTATELMDIFFTAMDKPSEMEKILSGVAEAGAKGFASGGHLFKTEGQKAWYELVKYTDPVRAEAYAKSVEIGGNVPKGAAQGIKNESGTAAEEMRNLGLTMIGQLNLLLNSEVTETLPGYIKLFGEAFTAMGETAGNFATTATTYLESLSTAIGTNAEVWYAYFAGLTDVIAAFDDLWVAFIDTSMVAKLDELNVAIGTHSETWYSFFDGLSEVIAVFDDLWVKFIDESMIAKIVLLEKALTGLYNTWIKIFDEMDKKTKEFADNTVKNFEAVQEGGSTLQTAMTGLYNTWNTIMDAMSNKVESFASACETAFEKVGKSADGAREKVEALQAAIDALKDKTVTITYKQVTTGSKPSAAQHGGAWIQNEPTKIGGVSVAETYPEAIVVTPLDPKEPNSPFHNLNVPFATPQNLPAISMQQGGGGGQGGQPVTVSGDIYLTVQTQSGETLANEVKPFLLKGFGGIT